MRTLHRPASNQRTVFARPRSGVIPPSTAASCVAVTPAVLQESVCPESVKTKLDSAALGPSPRNFIGRNISRLRYQRAWTQDQLVAKLQIHGCDISRDILASVETLRSAATDKQVWYLALVFNVDVRELFNPIAKPSAKHSAVPTKLAPYRALSGPPRAVQS